MSGWTKRESASNLTILGDEPGQVRRTGGLLIGVELDKQFADKGKENYRLVKQNGEEIVVSGSANLQRQLNKLDIGRFVKMEFNGWGRSANGKYKIIDVAVYDGELTPVMKNWPRYAEVQASLSVAPAPKAGAPRKPEPSPQRNERDEFEEFPAALEDDQDDLPF